MKPLDPFSQLATCCFGRRTKSNGGFKTAALRNQYYYSPSMAHMAAASAGWPMTSSGIAPTTIISGGLHPQALATQPYILLTQPVILNSAGQLESLPTQHTQATTMALVQQQRQQANQQVRAIQYITAAGDYSPLHKVPSLMPNQFAIYSTGGGDRALRNNSNTQAATSMIYETPTRHLMPMLRNTSVYLNQQQQSRRNAPGLELQQRQPCRQLTSEIFKRLELIERQVDLSVDMDLVERLGMVITRAIEPITLAPHLNDDMLRRYQSLFLYDQEHVIKFIEIIKRPGQTLGLYIRAVQFEMPQMGRTREGIVITKIESDSPVYTSKVLHIGDEILSINLIDIQAMSLDDVVTLMSIPKRLVLVLRIPKERESKFSGCELIEQQQHRQPARSIERQQEVTTSERFIRSGDEQFLSEDVRQTSQRPVGSSISQTKLGSANLESSGDTNQDGRQGEFSVSSGTHLALPARIRSAAIREVLDEDELETCADWSSDTKQANQDSQMVFMDRATHSTGAQGQFLDTDCSLIGEPCAPTHLQLTNGQRREQRPRSPIISQIDRQIAISQSVELESRSDNSAGLDRFRNYSLDPEIAKLERDAINKERPSSQEFAHMTRDQSGCQRSRYNVEPVESRKAEEESASSVAAPNTLPRRTLPTRPDLVGSPMSIHSPESSIKPTVISNIRLGDTSEQSNYFTSSIDAINRELKELRRQRLAMGSSTQDESVAQASDLKRDPALKLDL